MAVLTCTRRDDLSGQDTGDTAGYKEMFICTVSPTDTNGHAVILNSNLSTIPQVGDAHPVDTRATVKNRSVKATKNRQTFILEVTYEYKLEAGDDQGGGGGGSALQVLEIQGGVWYEDYIAEQDQNGVRYQNSAKDPIEKTSTRSHPQFTVITRSQEYQVPDFIYFTNHVNNNQYNILGLSFKENTLLFDEFNFKNLDNGWWEYTFRFKARLAPRMTNSSNKQDEGKNQDLGWNFQTLDAGFREVNQDTKRLEPIIVKDDNDQKTGQPVTQPWPLNGGGVALTPKEVEDDNWHWLEFQEKPRVGFWIFNWDWTTLLSKKAFKLGF